MMTQTTERASSDVRTKPVVVAGTDVDTSQAVTFATSPIRSSTPAGSACPSPTTTGVSPCTMEWGTSVRGRYELVCPPELIVMRWDFDDDNIPVPGGEITGYLRIQPRPDGAYVEVHQLVDTPAQAEFMEGAWATVLGRLKAGVARASERARPWNPVPAAPS